MFVFYQSQGEQSFDEENDSYQNFVNAWKTTQNINECNNHTKNEIYQQNIFIRGVIDVEQQQNQNQIKNADAEKQQNQKEIENADVEQQYNQNEIENANVEQQSNQNDIENANIKQRSNQNQIQDSGVKYFPGDTKNIPKNFGGHLKKFIMEVCEQNEKVLVDQDWQVFCKINNQKISKYNLGEFLQTKYGRMFGKVFFGQCLWAQSFLNENKSDIQQYFKFNKQYRKRVKTNDSI